MLINGRSSYLLETLLGILVAQHTHETTFVVRRLLTMSLVEAKTVQDHIISICVSRDRDAATTSFSLDSATYLLVPAVGLIGHATDAAGCESCQVVHLS